MPPARTTETARAKVNLTLHVTGRRADGYHLLDSLAAFTEAGDTVSVARAPATSLDVTGPFAQDVPRDGTNLALRAAAIAGPGCGVALRLVKRLPPASGLGGGSADAAAVVRAMARHFGAEVRADPSLYLPLGADLPVCLASRASRMRGVGEVLDAVPVPACPILLVNPGVPVPTGAVYAALADPAGAPMPGRIPAWEGPRDLARWLADQRNDLARPALEVAPAIGAVLAALAAQPGALVARMSGSGGTCLALFERDADCAAAAAVIARAEPGWWVMPTRIAGPEVFPPQAMRATT